MWTLIIASVLFISIVCCYILLWINSKRVVSHYKFSDYRIEQTSKGSVEEKQHSIMENASIDLSIVFPAYLEEDRITHTLTITDEYLRHRLNKEDPNFTWEMIVVDDGSRDRTSQVVRDFIKKQNDEKSKNRILLLPLGHNKGKGFAVKQGVLRSRGKYVLMADADSATDIADLKTLEEKLKLVEDNRGHGMAIGSRAHMAQGVVRERKWYRNILMHGWHFLVKYVAGVSHIDDTQCGFKLFTRETAKQLFLNLKIDRWCFDIDLFHIAMKFNVPYVEVPVNWREIEGSKMNLKGMVVMGIDLLLIRLYYMLGFWTVNLNATIPSQ